MKMAEIAQLHQIKLFRQKSCTKKIHFLESLRAQRKKITNFSSLIVRPLNKLLYLCMQKLRNAHIRRPS